MPIALSYGLVPEKSMSYLFDISETSVNLFHILRAVMGLYLALIIFWIIGVFKQELQQAAMYSLIVFMYGLAAGRILSLIIDGSANWLLIVYLALEITCGTAGIVLIKLKEESK